MYNTIVKKEIEVKYMVKLIIFNFVLLLIISIGLFFCKKYETYNYKRYNDVFNRIIL